MYTITFLGLRYRGKVLLLPLTILLLQSAVWFLLCVHLFTKGQTEPLRSNLVILKLVKSLKEQAEKDPIFSFFEHLQRITVPNNRTNYNKNSEHARSCQTNSMVNGREY